MAQGDIRFSLINGEGAVSVNVGDLSSDVGLETCIALSLFTNARAEEDDVLPDNTLNKQGWWGNSVAEIVKGSRLWLISRSKNTDDVREKAKDYALEALKWMVDDGVIKNLTVIVTRTAMDTIEIKIQATKPKGGSDVVFKYFYNWQNQLLR